MLLNFGSLKSFASFSLSFVLLAFLDWPMFPVMIFEKHLESKNKGQVAIIFFLENYLMGNYHVSLAIRSDQCLSNCK